MARSKSITGGKTNRTNNIEQPGASVPAKPPEVNTVAETTTQAAPTVKAAREANLIPPAQVPTEAKIPAEAKAAPESRIFELTKTDSRKNVVPINLEDEIRRRAYELYQQRGPGYGTEAGDWLTAEREITLRLQVRSRATSFSTAYQARREDAARHG